MFIGCASGGNAFIGSQMYWNFRTFAQLVLKIFSSFLMRSSAVSKSRTFDSSSVVQYPNSTNYQAFISATSDVSQIRVYALIPPNTLNRNFDTAFLPFSFPKFGLDPSNSEFGRKFFFKQ
jgi:hypothetical protein